MAKVVIERVSPMLIIGLGGTGAMVIRYLKKKLGRVPTIAYLLIDSDSREKDKDGVILKDEEFVYIGVTGRICELIKNLPGLEPEVQKSIRSWFPDSPSPRYADSEGFLGEGAQQTRPLGRLVLFYNALPIFNRISHRLGYIIGDGITETRNLGYTVDEMDRRIFIISSLGGGQGSSIFIDVAHLAGKAAEGRDFEPNGIFILPSAFRQLGTIQMPAVWANSYAALLELEHFMTQRQFNFNYNQQEINRDSKPFHAVYAISGSFRDYERGRSRELSLPKVVKVVGEFICSFPAIRSNAGNQFQNSIDPAIRGGRYYGGFGYYETKFPRDEIIAYCRNRLGEKICEEILEGSFKEREREAERRAGVDEGFTSQLSLKELKKQITFPKLSSPPEIRVEEWNWPKAQEDLSRAKENISNEANTYKKRMEKEAEKKKEEIEKKLSQEVLEIVNSQLGIKFALEFIPKAKGQLEHFIEDARKKLEGSPEEIGLKNERQILSKQVGNFEEDLKYMIEHPPLLFRRRRLGKVRDRAKEVLSYFKDFAEKDLEVNQSEQIIELWRRIIAFLNQLHQKWEKIELITESLKDDFFYNKDEEKRKILREGGEIFGEREEKVIFSHDVLKEISERDFASKARQLIEDQEEQKLFKTGEETKEMLKEKVWNSCKNEYKDWESKTIAEILEERKELEKVIRDLHENAVAFWSLGPGFSRDSSLIVKGIVTPKAQKSEVEKIVGEIGGINVIGSGEEQIINVIRLEYGACLSNIGETEACKREYESEKDFRDVHVFPPFKEKTTEEKET